MLWNTEKSEVVTFTKERFGHANWKPALEIRSSHGTFSGCSFWWHPCICPILFDACGKKNKTKKHVVFLTNACYMINVFTPTWKPQACAQSCCSAWGKVWGLRLSIYLTGTVQWTERRSKNHSVTFNLGLFGDKYHLMACSLSTVSVHYLLHKVDEQISDIFGVCEFWSNVN